MSTNIKKRLAPLPWNKTMQFPIIIRDGAQGTAVKNQKHRKMLIKWQEKVINLSESFKVNLHKIWPHESEVFLLYILQCYIYVCKVSIVMFSPFEVFLFLRQISLLSFKFSDDNRQQYLISTLLSMRHLPGKIFDSRDHGISNYSSLLSQPKDNGA